VPASHVTCEECIQFTIAAHSVVHCVASSSPLKRLHRLGKDSRCTTVNNRSQLEEVTSMRQEPERKGKEPKQLKRLRRLGKSSRPTTVNDTSQLNRLHID
jgi:hypothetical protein